MPTNKITQNDFTVETFYIGLDVYKKPWSVTVRTSGLEIEQFTQTPDVHQLVRHLKNKFQGATFYSAYEADMARTEEKAES